MTNDELAKRIEALEAELAELRAQLPKPEKPVAKSRMPYVPHDYTENFRLPADAAQKMAAVVPDPPKKTDMEAWARNRIGEPGGFGPGPSDKWPKPEPTKVRKEEKLEVPPPPKSYWSK